MFIMFVNGEMEESTRDPMNTDLECDNVVAVPLRESTRLLCSGRKKKSDYYGLECV